MNVPHTSTNASHLPRRSFLRGMGVSLALPALECMSPAFARAEKPVVAPRRMLAIVNNLGLLPRHFAPTGTGGDYQPSPYLELLSDVRDEFTVFSGLSHPGVNGAHSTDKTMRRCKAFNDQPSSMKRVASQSSRSGCEGFSPSQPKLSGVRTSPSPK